MNNVLFCCHLVILGETQQLPCSIIVLTGKQTSKQTDKQTVQYIVNVNVLWGDSVT